MGQRLSKKSLKKTSPDIEDINGKSKKELLRTLNDIDKQLETISDKLHDKSRQKHSKKIMPTYYDVNKNTHNYAS
jgi:hypothetical protein